MGTLLTQAEAMAATLPESGPLLVRLVGDLPPALAYRVLDLVSAVDDEVAGQTFAEEQRVCRRVLAHLAGPSALERLEAALCHAADEEPCAVCASVA